MPPEAALIRIAACGVCGTDLHILKGHWPQPLPWPFTLRPDLVLVVGFSQIIPRSVLEIPPLGVIGFHTAVLPGRRGSAPVVWAMVEGLDESGVTMFHMDEGIDTGDVVAVERFPIDEGDYAADVLRKADDATLSLLRTHLDGLLDGTAQRIQQSD